MKLDNTTKGQGSIDMAKYVDKMIENVPTKESTKIGVEMLSMISKLFLGQFSNYICTFKDQISSLRHDRLLSAHPF